MIAPRNCVIYGPSPTEISTLFECPVCYEIILPPITACVLGHILCTTCQRKMPTLRCPLCQNFTATTRNLFAEKILDKTRITCKYAEAGCVFVGNGDAMKKHEPLCDFRPLACPDCEEVINFNQFVEHLEDDFGHPKNLTLTGGVWSTRVEFDFTPDEDGDIDYSMVKFEWLRYTGCEFFLHVQPETEFGTSIWVFLTMLADSNEVVNWKCAMQEICHEYKGPLNCIRASAFDFIKSGYCITLPNAVTFKKGTKIDIAFRIFPASEADPLPYRLWLAKELSDVKLAETRREQKENEILKRGGGGETLAILPAPGNVNRKGIFRTILEIFIDWITVSSISNRSPVVVPPSTRGVNAKQRSQRRRGGGKSK